MRVASTRLTSLVLAIAALALPASAAATPSVTFTANFAPIPLNPSQAHSRTYPHTGNLLGAGAVIEAAYTISGTEYYGFPLPLKGLTLSLPRGTTLHPHRFATCPKKTLERYEPTKCPKQSIASPQGLMVRATKLGSSVMHETLTLQAFFVSSGLLFYNEGLAPIWMRWTSTGRFTNASRPFGPKLVWDVPLASAMIGAPYDSFTPITVKMGAALKQGKRLLSYITVPKTCPTGGFRVTSDLTFGASEGPTGETVSVTTALPCPTK